jgi:hypothetical protein
MTDIKENPLQVQVVEKLADADKTTLDSIKLKRELALERAKTAVAQSESAQLAYDNVVLQLAMKYKLSDGDVIEDTGEIKRNSQLKKE